MGSHSVEHATGRTRELVRMVDLRQLNCPAPLFERILADRAAKLGRKFTEFRTSQRIAPQPNGEIVAIELAVENAKLF
jgi:hypothetical protein